MICTACGLCCDGSLFGQVPLEGDEEDRLRRLPIFADAVVDARLRLPCPALAERHCSVYDQRPATCARYRCRVLVAFEEGALDEAGARHTIERAHTLAGAIRAHLDPTQRALGVWRGSEERVGELAVAHAREALRELIRLRFAFGMLVVDEFAPNAAKPPPRRG
jgi:hypothetical protein